MRVFEKLNTPVAVLVVLAFFLVVDGFLFYRYQQALQSVEETAILQEEIQHDRSSAAEETTASPEQEATAAAEPTMLEETTSSAGQEEEQAEGLQVVVSVVNAPSWLQIYQDGQIVLEGVAEPDFSQQFEANQSVGIRAGNAGAVRVQANGQDFGPLGASGEVMRVTYSLVRSYTSRGGASKSSQTSHGLYKLGSGRERLSDLRYPAPAQKVPSIGKRPVDKID